MFDNNTVALLSSSLRDNTAKGNTRQWVSFKTLLRFSNSAENAAQHESLRQNQNWERSDQPYTQVQKHTEKNAGFQNETINLESLAGRCAPSSDFVSDRLCSTQTDPLPNVIRVLEWIRGCDKIPLHRLRI